MSLHGIPGMGCGCMQRYGMGDSPNLQQVQAATQAVHMDVAHGRTLAQARNDLARAAAYAEAIGPTDPEWSAAQALVSGAAADVQNLESHQAGASVAASAFNNATGAQQAFFASGGQPIDVGGGSVAFDAFGGTVNDLTMGHVSPSYAPGMPGDYAPQGAVGTRFWPGGSQGPPIKSGCDLLPWPISWACANPGTAVTLVLGLLAAPYVVPPVAQAVRGSFA